MTDKEKAMLWLKSFVKNKEPMTLIPKQLIRLMHDTLKEQDAKTQGADSGMCEICSFYERALPVKPVLDEQTGRIWLCGKCGTYVGFEDNDPHDPNEFDKYCRECGRPVLWEGR